MNACVWSIALKCVIKPSLGQKNEDLVQNRKSSTTLSLHYKLAIAELRQAGETIGLLIDWVTIANVHAIIFSKCDQGSDSFLSPESVFIIFVMSLSLLEELPLVYSFNK